MKHLLVAACLACLPLHQALALSCLKPAIERSFQHYSDARESYILVLGELGDKRNVVEGQESSGNGSASGESFTATFKGFQATRSGFDLPLETPVAVMGTCLSVWCGGISVDRPMLAFFEKTAFGYTLFEGPCGGAAYYNPTGELTAKALQCLRGGVCDAPF